jgi:hypothetical protein
MHRFKSLLIVIVFSLNHAGCGVLDPDDDRREDLREALRRWSSQDVEHYQYKFQRTGCECLPEWTRPYIVEVDGAQVLASRDAVTGMPAPESFHALTVGDLFALISDAIERDAHVLSVVYDRRAGFPAAIVIDYDNQIADDEFTIHASDFLPLR